MKQLKFLIFLFTLLLITLIPNLNVYAVQFGTGGNSCVYFENGGSYCSPVTAFSYNNNSYYGANYSYDPDLLDVTGETVIEFNNQSFCANQSTGGTLNFRLYHNYDFEQNPIDHIFTRENVNGVNYCSTSYVRSGRYSDITCTFNSSFSNQTLALVYQFNDIGISFPFTAGASNVSISESCGISTGDIINNQNQNTNSIINNQNQNTNSIINNQNQNTNSIINNQDSNTQDIIDNQDSNTQDIINNQNQNLEEDIKSNQVCSDIPVDKYVNVGSLSSNGSSSTSQDFRYTDYIKISKYDTLKLISKVSAGNSYLCFYTNKKNPISCISQQNLSVNDTLTIPSNAYYFRATITLRDNPPRPVWEYCRSGNQALNDSINGLNDTLNDTSQPNTSQDIQDMDDMVASDTPISDLITMPLTLINAYINGINSSCSPVNLGNLYGTDLILPCINLEQRLGSNLWNMIDVFFCIFMCYNIGMLFITAFDGITSLRDDFEGLYQPRHADVGYQPKHGGGN